MYYFHHYIIIDNFKYNHLPKPTVVQPQVQLESNSIKNNPHSHGAQWLAVHASSLRTSAGMNDRVSHVCVIILQVGDGMGIGWGDGMGDL